MPSLEYSPTCEFQIMTEPPKAGYGSNQGHTFGEARKARIPDSYGTNVTMHPGTLN